WAQWVRDPLITLGLRDPVDRITESKASDPRRRALIELFDLWHNIHKEAPVTAAGLDPLIIQLIDTNARMFDSSLHYSRQKIVGFLGQHAGTHVGGYVLVQDKQGPKSKPTTYYRLIREPGC